MQNKKNKNDYEIKSDYEMGDGGSRHGSILWS
jgi:hypothetical protein